MRIMIIDNNYYEEEEKNACLLNEFLMSFTNTHSRELISSITTKKEI